MNKAIYLLLLSLLLSQIYCDTTPADYKNYCGYEEDGTVKDEDNCHNRKLEDGDYRCCFVEVEGKYQGQKMERKSCLPLTKDEYDKIDDFVDAQEKIVGEGNEIDDFSIDCASNYIMISLLSLILLFL